MPDAAYYREWRRAHPEYRVRQNALRNEKRKVRGRGDRSQEYKNRLRRRLQANGENGCCLESCIVRKAKTLATARRKPDRRTALWDDIHEELVGICILAICEGKDPEVAMRAWLTSEWQYRFHKADLLYE